MIKIQYAVVIILIILCTSIIYSNHFNNEFHFDDSHTIQNNVYIRSIHNIPLFFKDARTFSNLPQNQSYRPVVSASLALDYWLGNGYKLPFFHFSSFIIFLLQGILMLAFFIKVFSVSKTGIGNSYLAVYFTAAFGVAFYMFHPANAETINYIIARSDLQSTFFVILAFVTYIYSPFSRKTFLYLLPVGIGALAKPTAIMFAPLFLFYVILFEEKMSLSNLFWKANVARLILVVKKTAPAFIFCALLYLFVDKMTPPTWVSGGSSTMSYLVTQPFVITHYFGIFFIPSGLSADTDWGLLENVWNIRFFIGIVFIVAMIYAAFYCSKWQSLRPISYGILWFFISLVPTSSIIPFSEVLNYHRVFFPFVGLALGACWSIQQLVNRYVRIPADVVIIYSALIALSSPLICYAYNTYERNKVWRTEETLWYDVTIKSPGNGRGMMNYGLVKMAMGDYATAEKYFTEAFKTLPYYSSLYINMGILKNATGDKFAAEDFLKKGIEYGADYPDTWFFYARFLCQYRRFTEAIPMLINAVNLSPAYMNARLILMKAYNETAQWDKLQSMVQETLNLDPANAEVLQYQQYAKDRQNKTVALPEATNDLTEIVQAEKIVQQNASPDNLLNLSVVYYNHGMYQKCIEVCNKALLSKPEFDLAYNNICSSYNRLEKWDDAIAAGEKGLKINPGNTLIQNNLKESRQKKMAQRNL